MAAAKKRKASDADEAEVVYFADAKAWRRWLERHHAERDHLWVGFHKTSSGTASITWPEAVDEALCFGWIDGIRKGVDEGRYRIRFTPRKPASIWSAVNIARVKELVAAKRMRPAGMAAFDRRRDDKIAIYSYEQRKGATLAPEQQAALEANAEAWRFFQAQPPWYRRAAIHWVTSAKLEPTRARRLATLIDDSARGRPVPPLIRPGKKG